jgi:hypothetical protein
MNKQLSPANRVLSAIWEGLVLGGVGAALIRNEWRIAGVCVILVAVALAVWILLPSSEN